MFLENERKFLITKMPYIKDLIRTDTIRQGYLVTEGPTTVRIRVATQLVTNGIHRPIAATVCIKMKADVLGTPEFEYVVSMEDALQMLSRCGTHVIEKIRYLYKYREGPENEVRHNVYWHIDIFKGNLKGLTVAELESTDYFDCKDAKLPSWIGKEVTKNKLYKNKRLAVNQTFPNKYSKKA